MDEQRKQEQLAFRVRTQAAAMQNAASLGVRGISYRVQ